MRRDREELVALDRDGLEDNRSTEPPLLFLFYMASPLISALTQDNFEKEVLQSVKPVLVDFWAEWCGPCKALTPRVEQIAQNYAGKIKVVSVNVDQNPEVPSSYHVRSIPTLLLFKEGKLVGEIVGNVPLNNIEDLVKKAL